MILLKKRFGILGLLLATLLGTSLRPVEGQFAIRLAPGQEVQDVLDSTGGELVRYIPEIRWVVIRGRLSPTLLMLSSGVEIVHEDDEVTISGVPRDPLWEQLWGARRVTEEGKAFDFSRGRDDVVVAVLDTGVVENHPDLGGARCVWSAFPGPCTDGHGHGTHVAGTIAARWNEQGVVGICPGCQVWGYKVLTDNGFGTFSSVASGIVKAANDGVEVINMSLGGDTGGRVIKIIEDAVNYARRRGVLIAAAAGNSGKDYCSAPANTPGVLCVAATDQRDRKANFSNYGKDLDISAPGVSILSTTRDGGYQAWSGTSMATPHVAGALALLLSYREGWSPERVEQALLAAADRVGDPRLFGAGIVNVYRALSQDAPPPTPTAERPTPTAVRPTPSPTATPPPYPSPTRPASGYDYSDRVASEISSLPVIRVSVAREGPLLGRTVTTEDEPHQNEADDGLYYYRRGYRTVEGARLAPGRYLMVVRGKGNAAQLLVCLSNSSGTQELVRGVWNPRRSWWFRANLVHPGRNVLRVVVTWQQQTPSCLQSGENGEVEDHIFEVLQPRTPTPTPEGFWMWCSGDPLRCEERER